MKYYLLISANQEPAVGESSFWLLLYNMLLQVYVLLSPSEKDTGVFSFVLQKLSLAAPWWLED